MVIRNVDLRIAVRQPGDRRFLVRLSRAKPDVPDQDIADNTFVHFHHKRATRFLRRKLQRPFPGRSALSIVNFIPKPDGYLLAFICPAPYCQLDISLQHHAIPDQSGQPHFSPQHTYAHSKKTEQECRTQEAIRE